MINLQTFRKIKELKEQGVMVSKILDECKISKSQYYKWGMLDEKTFMRHIKSRVENGLYNYRDFILTNDFCDYVKDMGFIVRFCHKHAPESKAKVESVVHTVKSQFLKGRVYAGIDSLNGAAIEWLDRFGNGDYHHTTKKIPSDLFKEEYKYLTKVKIEKRDNVSIVAVRKLNHIAYQGNEYEIPNEYNLNIVM